MNFLIALECAECGARADPAEVANTCIECGSTLLAVYDLEAARESLTKENMEPPSGGAVAVPGAFADIASRERDRPR